jgi:hypothetical protein
MTLRGKPAIIEEKKRKGVNGPGPADRGLFVLSG